jgi:hypothetical protein
VNVFDLWGSCFGRVGGIIPSGMRFGMTSRQSVLDRSSIAQPTTGAFAIKPWVRFLHELFGSVSEMLCHLFGYFEECSRLALECECTQ